MNDCFWRSIGVCTGQCKCTHYLSMNSEKGQKSIDKYQTDVDVALIPVKKKWSKSFGGEYRC